MQWRLLVPRAAPLAGLGSPFHLTGERRFVLLCPSRLRRRDFFQSWPPASFAVALHLRHPLVGTVAPAFLVGASNKFRPSPEAEAGVGRQTSGGATHLHLYGEALQRHCWRSAMPMGFGTWVCAPRWLKFNDAPRMARATPDVAKKIGGLELKAAWRAEPELAFFVVPWSNRTAGPAAKPAWADRGCCDEFHQGPSLHIGRIAGRWLRWRPALLCGRCALVSLDLADELRLGGIAAIALMPRALSPSPPCTP